MITVYNNNNNLTSVRERSSISCFRRCFLRPIAPWNGARGTATPINEQLWRTNLAPTTPCWRPWLLRRTGCRRSNPELVHRSEPCNSLRLRRSSSQPPSDWINLRRRALRDPRSCSRHPRRSLRGELGRTFSSRRARGAIRS